MHKKNKIFPKIFLKIRISTKIHKKIKQRLTAPNHKQQPQTQQKTATYQPQTANTKKPHLCMLSPRWLLPSPNGWGFGEDSAKRTWNRCFYTSTADPAGAPLILQERNCVRCLHGSISGRTSPQYSVVQRPTDVHKETRQCQWLPARLRIR